MKKKKKLHGYNVIAIFVGNPWNCDCNFEWLAKDVLPIVQKNNIDLTLQVM